MAKIAEPKDIYQWSLGIFVIVLIAIIGYNFRQDSVLSEKVADVPCRVEVTRMVGDVKGDLEKDQRELKVDIMRVLEEIKSDQKEMARKIDGLFNRRD